ncbi:MAG TPA: HDOD domain-containing protein [Spirochaetota bacterium]|nr:HDOD domain-containing protein [Spirochaetota bacterium]HNT12905.1 HDOD domain-containing protein [Spirochaetota bacterium]HNV48293.1 HDOD domain-containing protein [Spirochaetota bacterium]HOS39303.1 HDOD domain-containing protein [Spirochaetota bacterium]HPI23123.1 HDOD domain-containing protein [Spirochaetota bacterium]
MPNTFEIKEIPPIQDVVLKVVRYELDNEISSSNELLNIITPDKGLSSEILRVANSAYYAGVGKVENLQTALNRLGLRTIKMLVMSAANSNIKAILRKGIYEKYIHQYPLVTAFIAVDLLKTARRTDINKDDIFIEGLLAKIGMTVIALNAKKEYAQVLETAEKKRMALTAVEEAAFKTNHIAVGAALARDWNLGDSIIEVIENPITDAAAVTGASDRVRIIACADIIARELTGCLVLEPELAAKSAIAAHYGLAPEALDAFNAGYLAALQENPLFTI